MRNGVRRRRALLIWACHAVIITAALVGAFLLRFDFQLPPEERALIPNALLLALPLKAIAIYYVGLQHGWWVIAGVRDAGRILVGNLLASILFVPAAAWLIGPPFPRSVYALDFLLCALLMALARFSVRFYNEVLEINAGKSSKSGVLIYGADKTAEMLLREIRLNPTLGLEPLGLIDDDPHGRRREILGVPVRGAGRELPRIVEKLRLQGRAVEQVIIALPSATGREMREALAHCRAVGVSCKTVPGIGEILEGQGLSAQIRELRVEDLLQRDPVRLEEDRIREDLRGRSVLVTGAAGSIGSELCRQILRFAPRRLVMFDKSESELVLNHLDLRKKHPDIDVWPAIGDLRDADRLEFVMRKAHAEVVFHAAAYKHVPLMEENILEAVKNNVLGTWNVVRLSRSLGVQRFLMISTDKAVNPTSVMGATKRVSELITCAAPAGPQDRYLSVRFGNVLGSNGSVVPIFRKQISEGGPVTVTHPEVRRYFMTIPEAVQLVLQASTMGQGSEVFVLDMGEPVKIVDLARNMIRLAGFKPDDEIEIRFTGLRPGERLEEVLELESERLVPTRHAKINIFAGPTESESEIRRWITDLRDLIERKDEPGILRHLMRLVPEYVQQRPSGGPQVERREFAAAASGAAGD